MIRSIISATAAVASAAILAGSAVPAFAEEATPQLVYKAQRQVFCTQPEAPAGSIFATSKCKTADGWAKAGLTVYAKKASAQR